MAQTKRTRIGKPQSSRKKQRNNDSKSTAVARSLKAVPVDALAWQEVALPDRLEDAEGFFGLEEIDDVEVLRDSGSGAVHYRVASNGQTASNENKDLDGQELVKGNDYDDTEWKGFEDDTEGEELAVKPPDEKVSKKTARKQAKTAKNDRKSGQGVKPNQSVNAFEGLSDDEDEGVDVTAWATLELSQAITTSLSRMKFSKPTKIQSAAIPVILQGLDVIGKASTGSGKTLAFGIPIVEHFLSTVDGEEDHAKDKEERTRPPVAMILSPTRELAHQLGSHLGELCSKIPERSPRIAILTGGLSLHKQQRLLATANIIIGTPGRLWEVIGSAAGLLIWLRQIKFLVVDEADRLLSEGHFKEVEEILNSLDREDVDNDPDASDSESPSAARLQRQTLVFSATFEKDLQRKLAGKGRPQTATGQSQQQSMEYLLQKLSFRPDQKPRFIDVNPQSQMASNLREGLVECNAMDKDLYLYALLLHHSRSRILTFVNSIDAVRRIVPLLQNLNLPAHGLHSQMPQKARLRSLERFSSTVTSAGNSKFDANGTNQASILVATDVAARGLDIPSVDLVLHYDTPRDAAAYVHRSGRTARAEAAGTSIMLCAPDEVVSVRRLIAKIHARARNADASSGLQTLDIDRRVVGRLKSRVSLAKTIADSGLAKERVSAEKNWLKNAAEELGVDYDEEEFASEKGGKGRGKGRAKREKEQGGRSKEDIGRLRAELRAELGKRVNVGVSERYLTAGGVDVQALLDGEDSPFLGRVDGIAFD